MSLRLLSGQVLGDTNEADSPIHNGRDYEPGAEGTSCVLNQEEYGLGSEVCWGHVKLVCGKNGWTRAGECGHGND